MKYFVFLVFLALAIIATFTSQKQSPTPPSQPTPIDIYTPPTVATSSSYTIIFLGDSMVEALGDNFDSLRQLLKAHYPEKTFGLFNYGFGSTNILSVEQRLTKDNEYLGKVYPAILNRYFDVIILESMGNNPLSQYPIEEGLKIQTETLQKVTSLINFHHPQSVIVFLATIAPSQTHYGRGVVDLSAGERNSWANERRFYIENHINFAKIHHFPLINVYEKSLDQNGNALLKYLNPDNYIHPSRQGIELISQEIADYLYQILPQ